MTEHKVFTFDLFQAGLPRQVTVSLPRTRPFATTEGGAYFRGATLAEAVAKELGVDDAARVRLLDAALDWTLPAKTYADNGYAFILAEGAPERQLWEVLLEGGGFLATEGGNQTLAHLFFQKVMELKRDPVWVYSLFRHMTLTLPPSPTKYTTYATCLEFDSMIKSSSTALITRGRLCKWGAIDSAATPSLLEVLLTLPPPFRLCDFMPVESLVALARTCRAWWVRVMGHELPSLLRRLLTSEPSLSPFAWRTDKTARLHSHWWTTAISIHHHGSPSPSVSHETSPQPTFFPLVHCPRMLKWILKPGRKGQPVPASALMGLVGQSFADPWRAACPEDKIALLLRVALVLATSKAVLEWRCGELPRAVAHLFVPFYEEQDEKEEDSGKGVEIVWRAKWTSKQRGQHPVAASPVHYSSDSKYALWSGELFGFTRH